MAINGTTYVVGTASGSPINWLSDNIYAMLLGTTGTFSQDNWKVLADVSGSACGASGTYPAAGSLLTGKTVTYDAGTNTNAFDAADLAYTAATITAGSVALYNSSVSGSPLITITVFDSPVTATSGSFTNTWNASGIWKTVAS
jgi:hypothetical protein